MHSNEIRTEPTDINIENLRDAEFTTLFEESKKKLDELTVRADGKPSLLQLAQQNQNQETLNQYYQIAVNYFKLYGVSYTSANDSTLYQRTILYWAIACFQHSDVLEELIQDGSSANQKYYDDEDYSLISAFSTAIRLKNLNAVRILLTHCPDLAVQQISEHGDMPAHYAAQHDAVEILEELYKVNPDITHIPTGPLDIAPIHTAAMFGRTRIAAWILAHDTTACNLANSSGFTALHLAVVNSHPEMTTLLLQHGADINLRTKPGSKLPDKTPLQLAADAGKNDIVRVLLKHQQKIDALQIPDYSAVIKQLHLAAVNCSKLDEYLRVAFALLDYVDALSKRKGEYLNTFLGVNPNPYAYPASTKAAAAKKVIRNLLNNEPDPFVNLDENEYGALKDKYSRGKIGLRDIVLPLLQKYRPGSSPVTPNKLSPQMR